jgi:hypothetical protein
MDIYLTNNTFFDAKASYTTTVYANTPTVFVCEITSQTNKRSALIGPTNQQVVANTVCWFIEHPGQLSREAGCVKCRRLTALGLPMLLLSGFQGPR